MLSGRCRWLASGVRAAVFFQNPIPRALIIWWQRVLLLCCLGVPHPSKKGLGADAVSPIREGESSREGGGRLQALGEAKPTEGHLLLHPHLGAASSAGHFGDGCGEGDTHSSPTGEQPEGDAPAFLIF